MNPIPNVAYIAYVFGHLSFIGLHFYLMHQQEMTDE